MKKCCLLIVLLLCLSVFSAAADGIVSYQGQAEKFLFAPGSRHSPTDLFDNFKDVMPGDHLTQKILVKNDVKNNVKIKVYMRSLGAHEDSAAFLSQMQLTVRQEGGSELFAAPSDQTAQLTDWVCLGTVYSGGNITLDVTLDVPATMDNRFQEAIGYLDWEFKVEELPASDDDPSRPATGEKVLFLRITLAASVAAFLLLALAAKRRRA